MTSFNNFISVSEAANIAEVAASTMRLAAQKGHIRAIKPARNWLIDKTDIARWKAENYQPNKKRNDMGEADTEPPSDGEASS